MPQDHFYRHPSDYRLEDKTYFLDDGIVMVAHTDGTRNCQRDVVASPQAEGDDEGPYALSWEKETINDLIEKTILDADTSGVKVLTLGLLNQVRLNLFYPPPSGGLYADCLRSPAGSPAVSLCVYPRLLARCPQARRTVRCLSPWLQVLSFLLLPPRFIVSLPSLVDPTLHPPRAVSRSARANSPPIRLTSSTCGLLLAARVRQLAASPPTRSAPVRAVCSFSPLELVYSRLLLLSARCLFLVVCSFSPLELIYSRLLLLSARSQVLAACFLLPLLIFYSRLLSLLSARIGLLAVSSFSPPSRGLRLPALVVACIAAGVRIVTVRVRSSSLSALASLCGQLLRRPPPWSLRFLVSSLRPLISSLRSPSRSARLPFPNHGFLC
ncbi:Protein ECERIFERUM 1 [Platanthera zijinensis]|uniref:Protein ECERIFERUM 1 n=1 Tax=Platanthera zijinensis TaxID=2320716 RepID=A0AAP0BJD7_9ASPA